MTFVLKATALVAIVLVRVACTVPESGKPDLERSDNPYLGQHRPERGAEVFAGGVVSTEVAELSPALSADRREFYFTRSVAGRLVLHFTREDGGAWSKLQPAAFGSGYLDPSVGRLGVRSQSLVARFPVPASFANHAFTVS